MDGFNRWAVLFMLNEVMQEKLKFYRLSEDEYQMAKNALGRDLKDIEWPIFSALWSEHCSYKSSKIHLRKFSYRNAMTPDMDGENAGIVDLGYGEKIAFKMESHNHPSFIEPVQGAATGVGGILRDIFTMGARPIALANYLCFGDKNATRMPELMSGVVQGISMYGNCVGVPMLSGQTNFHEKYNQNILVNAMAVGYYSSDMPIALSKVNGIGNYIVYVGAKTGRDGVHGASMASASFDQDTDSKKPNVQIGDPFFEKLLIEACLEVLKLNLVVAMQDMGAAGLTSSSFEMSSNGQMGFDLDLKKVPLRDQTMTAEEILLSESQERMLLVCKPENFDHLSAIFHKWNLDATVLGKIKETKNIKLMWGQETLTEIDPNLIVKNPPKYDRPYEKWINENQTDNTLSLNVKKNKNLIHKESLDWIYNQYDQRVGCRTAQDCSSPVGFVQLDQTKRGLSIAVGCRPEIMKMDAQIGALDAVYYPAFQMAVQGSKILAITDCLNFGNPQKNKIMSEFVVSVESIAQASRELDAPVISGNVSFYNETVTDNIISTPATGIIGLRDSVENLIPTHFISAHESVVCVTYNWIQSYLFVNEKMKLSSQFNQDFDVSPAQFIELCQSMDYQIQEQKIKITSIRTCGLGGVELTAQKMSTDFIGFEILPEFSSEDLLKDVFYQFLVTTTEVSSVLDFFEVHFRKLKNKERAFKCYVVGQTTERKI
jgi:phosphoribosylformylglycinamidine synthase II